MSAGSGMEICPVLRPHHYLRLLEAGGVLISTSGSTRESGEYTLHI